MLHSLHTPQDAAQWLRASVPGALRTDHRKVEKGDGFLAAKGQAVDARQFVGMALERGAAACLVEAQDSAAWTWDSAQIASYPALKIDSAAIAADFYGAPSEQLDVLAITGTNGKTSSAWWLAQALNSATPAHPRCAMVGTLGIGVPPAGQEGSDSGLASSGLTTPDGVLLQHSLHEFVRQGLRYCSLEASSIGLQEHRLDATRIRLAIFTNFTQDHLDYHVSMQAYWDAKRRLFDWAGLQSAVINIDDERGAALAQELRAQDRGLDVWTVSTQGAARLQATDIALSAQGLQCSILEGGQRHTLQCAVLGHYNVANLLGVIAALRALGLGLADAVQACSHLQPVPGRLQCEGGQDAPLAVVDYAHTPDALQKTLDALRPLAQQRGGLLWCVFGCGGDRDNAKRPLMGAIAAAKADRIVITNDNPRFEKPSTIVSHILAGMGGAHDVEVQMDRAQAIAHCLARASAADVVLIAGKGHEASQETAGEKIVFSDLAHARQALAERSAQGVAA